MEASESSVHHRKWRAVRLRWRVQRERRLASAAASGDQHGRDRRDEQRLQNGIACTACLARSINGWTAKNDPTVTTRHTTTEPCNTVSLGGEPPLGASCRSYVRRMKIARTTP